MSNQNPPAVNSIAPDSAARDQKRKAALAAGMITETSEAPPAEGKRTATGGTKRTASKRSASAAGESVTTAAGTPAKRAPRPKKPDLKKELREFASARPQGWNHEDWLAFLEDLQSRGHNISDREAIGVALERERLLMALGRVSGIAPARRQAIVKHYNNIWELRNAEAEEIAQVGGISPADADRIKSELS